MFLEESQEASFRALCAAIVERFCPNVEKKLPRASNSSADRSLAITMDNAEAKTIRSSGQILEKQFIKTSILIIKAVELINYLEIFLWK